MINYKGGNHDRKRNGDVLALQEVPQELTR
jgi:hypothetical protein